MRTKRKLITFRMISGHCKLRGLICPNCLHPEQNNKTDVVVCGSKVCPVWKNLKEVKNADKKELEN